MGIVFDQYTDYMMDIIQKNNNETSTEYLILTGTSRLFTITIYN
jgi:hypothetical protein